MAALKSVGAAELARRLASFAPGPEASEISSGRRRIRDLAALHGWFDLGRLTDGLNRAWKLDDETLRAFVEADCERVRTPRGTGAWRLRLDVRREVIDGLVDDDEEPDEEPDFSRLLATLELAPLEDDDLAGRVAASFLGSSPPSLETLDRAELVAALTASAWLVETDSDLPSDGALRKRLRQVSLMAPLEAVRDLPILGRDNELEEIDAYVHGAAAMFRPLVIHGPGGIGKSAVIAQYLLSESAELSGSRLFAYLTFDRDDLLPQRPFGLVAEVVRQVGLQHPDLEPMLEGPLSDLISIDVRGSSAEADRLNPSRGPRTDFFYDFDLAWQRVAELLQRAGRMLLIVVLDTFERAQRQGYAAVERLWETLARASATMPELRVVILGRKPVTDLDVRARPLSGLTVGVGIEVLRSRLGDLRMDRGFLEQVSTQVRGIPLALRLAADLMVREEENLHTDEGRRQFLLDLPETSVQGILYRRVLAHVDDEDVAQLAVPGLVLRRLTPDVIRVVLAPACGLGAITRSRAESLFTALRTETTLVDEDGDTLVHRADVRQEVLPLMDPDVVATLHRRAVKYYKRRRDTSDRTEELYHRLALDQTPSTLDSRWDPVAGSRLDSALEELPARAQAYVSSKLDLVVDPVVLQMADDHDWALQTARAARALLTDGKVDAALAALEERRPAELAYEIAGLMVEALARARRTDDAMRAADSAIEAAAARGDAPQVVRFLLLQAQIAEDLGNYQAAIELLLQAGTAARRYGDLVQALSASTGILRLHRRSGEEASTHRLRKDVVAAAEALPRRELRRSPALLRDLAAEVGSELPWVVVEASKLVGIDVVSGKARAAHEREGREDSAHIVLEAMGNANPLHEDDGDADSYEPVTSGSQGSSIGEYLDSHDDDKVREAVSDLFKSDAEAPSFLNDDVS